MSYLEAVSFQESVAVSSADFCDLQLYGLAIYSLHLMLLLALAQSLFNQYGLHSTHLFVQRDEMRLLDCVFSLLWLQPGSNFLEPRFYTGTLQTFIFHVQLSTIAPLVPRAHSFPTTTQHSYLPDDLH